MMITIHGLPPKTTFQAIKALVKQECNIIDFILDNLVDDGPNCKKVRIGLSNDAEGYRIAKCLNGFRMSPSHLLKIVPVGKPLNPPSQHSYDQRSGLPTRNDYPNQSRPNYQNQPVEDYGNRGSHSSTDTRKGNYAPPNTRHLGPHGAPDPRSSDSMRPTDVRPHVVEQRHHGPISFGTHGPQDAIRSQQWGSNMNSTSNQWPQAQSQSQNNTYNQMTSQPSFGQQAPHRDTRQHVLREVDIVDTVPAPTRPYEQEKPVTIMKDNFQGPTQYAAGQFSQHGNYSGPAQAPTPTWSQSGQQSKPAYDDRRHQPLDKRPDVPKPQEYEKRGHFIPIGSARPLSPPRRTSPTRVVPANAGRNYDDSGRRLSPGRSFSGSERRISPSRLGPPVNRLGPPVNRLGPPVREFSPSGRRISPTGRKISPTGRRMSPIGRRVSPGRRLSPTGRKISPTGRRVSPTGRRVSPTGRRVSPTGRRVSPTGRRVSPTGRRVSPAGRRSSPGRRDDARRMSPNDRRMGRRESPRRFSPKRASPSRRLESPPPRPIRYSRPSPGRLADKPPDKFMDVGKGVKPVRPAYEPTHAPNQTHTGGYRTNVHENVQYPIIGRQQEQRSSPWQGDKIIYPSGMKKDEDRRDMARRLEKQSDKSPGRLSRSPVRRDRSPLKDRYRRHSPSPRSSRSPRRSWALEKRSSPEAVKEPPPPPIWPGQEADVKTRKSRYNDEPKHAPVWDELHRRPDEDRRTFDTKLRVRTDLDDKFASNRREFDDRRDYHDDADRKQHERDREYHRRDERPEFSRRASPRHDDKKVFIDIDKDFQDIYKRAVEFRKRTEERKSGERRREEYEGQSREEQLYRRDDSPRRERSCDRDDFGKGREWNTTDRKRMFLSPSVKSKRDKAVEEISNRILDKYDMLNDHRCRVMEELRLSLSNIFLEMFSDKDVSFIELIIKYQAKYPANKEEKLIQDVLSRLPSHFRNLKRKATGDASEVPKKTSRRSPARNTREENPRPKLADAVIPEWNTGLEPPKVLDLPVVGMSSMAPVVPAVMNPVMVPPPLYTQSQLEMPQQHVYPSAQQLQYGNTMQQHQQTHYIDNSMQQQQQHQYEPPVQQNEYYNLYLCQDDFEPFSEMQAEYLKNFLVKQIVKVTETSNGWAPDITLKGLQSLYRYELSTKDEMSKDWVLNLNFGEFEFFNILVYTKEELWYERAAIWLPGHSRSRNIEPLEKLKMQNRRLEGVNIGKWKFVKKIVTIKGTRLYVDMPPSSARALEKHKMMLSYELQKVNVFLKAVAVDKDSFDAGLKEISITDPSLLVSAVQNSPMPTLNVNTEPSIVKIGLNGQKSMTIEQARKIKEVVVYFLFKYHQQDGGGKTDFVKYGFCPPCYIGIVPENTESKRWLISRNFGKMNRHTIVVFGGDEENTKYFKMFAHIPHEYHQSSTLAFERLKQSNQGIKGIHFNLWKPISIANERKRAVLELEIDLESIEVLSRMKYKMDYVGEFGIQVVDFKSEYSLTKLEEKIRKCKMELADIYDVANMDLDSDSERDEVICLD